ncbi:hypothetical protein B0A55_05083 [Friedmanniomyces simplex]|uniref:Cutinase n=1 Tax=Friedmanniomyces simplex TaxID=329884 RepID=A0A4U0XGN5_9PEZI|nr:hypothetical protein B0A55_05083 [Friedmanniomyces simplex]
MQPFPISTTLITSQLLVSSCVLAVSPSHLDPRSQCYSGVFTLVARGSEEPQGQSVLETIASSITAAIPNSGSNEVVYPALLSFWNSAPTGVTNAQQQLQDYYSACPDGKIVIMGYSQGSYVMSTTLAGGNYSGESWAPLASNIGQNIAAVVLFGDQSRMLGQGTIAEGTNCADPCTATSPLALTSPYNSSMEAYTDRLEEWCAAADPICCKTGTDIQAHLSYWSTNTTDTVVHNLIRHLIGNKPGHKIVVDVSIYLLAFTIIGLFFTGFDRFLAVIHHCGGNPLLIRLEYHRYLASDGVCNRIALSFGKCFHERRQSTRAVHGHLEAGVFLFGVIEWASVGNNLTPTSQLISIGNLGGATGCNIYSSQQAPHYWLGFGLRLGILVAGVTCTLLLRVAKANINKKRDATSEEEIASNTEAELLDMGDQSPWYSKDEERDAVEHME